MFKTILRVVAFSLSAALLLPASSYGFNNTHRIVVHRGICDASGVVHLKKGRFAVADDELNMLLVYDADGSGEPIYKTELSRFLDVVKAPRKKQGKPKKEHKMKVKEVDIEGATRVGNTVYWISSHGRKHIGKDANERMRFFATVIGNEDKALVITPKGTPYDGLIDDLLRDPRYARLGLATAATRAPKEVGGLNIEALADRADGTLLIGFRSPLIEGKALAAPLLNPEKIIGGEDAKFGDPILVDLDGRGIRGLASHDGKFLIAANDPEGDDHRPQLFHWDGATSRVAAIKSVAFGDFNPEAVAVLPDYRGGQVLMLSDDGTRTIGPDACRCKDLKDHSQRQFRSVTIDYAALHDVAQEIGRLGISN